MVPVDGLLSLPRQRAGGRAAQFEPVVMVGGSNEAIAGNSGLHQSEFLLNTHYESGFL